MNKVYYNFYVNDELHFQMSGVYQKLKAGEPISLKYENALKEIMWIKYKITDVKELIRDSIGVIFEFNNKYRIINITLEEVKK